MLDESLWKRDNEVYTFCFFIRCHYWKGFQRFLISCPGWIHLISVCLLLQHKELSESPPAFITNELLLSALLGYCDANYAAWSKCAEARVRAQVFSTLYPVLTRNRNMSLQRIMCLSTGSHFGHQVPFLLYVFGLVVRARLRCKALDVVQRKCSFLSERWEFENRVYG